MFKKFLKDLWNVGRFVIKKKAVIEGLEYFASLTENKVDDEIVSLVKKCIMNEAIKKELEVLNLRHGWNDDN